jgi:hypothetical protein
VTIDTAISGLPTCVRKAWLVLASGATIQLDNPAGGWMCQSLDLGTPIMRTVMNNNPDGDGIIDRTQYMGARTVTAAITALTGAGATSIDAVAASFAPYMVPSQRPVLHYVLDRPGAPERTLTLRPDAYDWPIVGAAQRDIALQWIAPNPISYDPTQQSLIVTTTTNQTLHSPGDVPVRPLLAITGPITTAKIDLKAFPTGSGSFFDFKVFFKSGFVIPAGQVVTVDCAAHTATITAGGSGSVLNQIDWTISVMWPVLPVNPGASVISMTGSATDVPTQCAVLWNDGYWT